jgi:hypothetical protein
MYIGIGTIVVIVIIVLVILMLRRRLCSADAPTRIICRMSKALWRLRLYQPSSACRILSGQFQPGRAGHAGNGICGSGAVARPGRPGRVEADEAWLRLSLQVQAIDPRRQPP